MTSPVQQLLALSTGPGFALSNTGGTQQTTGSNPSRQLSLGLDPAYFTLSVDYVNGQNNVGRAAAIFIPNGSQPATPVSGSIIFAVTGSTYVIGSSGTVTKLGNP